MLHHFPHVVCNGQTDHKPWGPGQASDYSHSRPNYGMIESTPKVMEYQKALEAVWSENDLLRRYQWPCRRFGQYKLRPAYPPIRNVPFQPIPAADKPSTLGQYAMATRALFGLAKSPPT
ncbi:hypothetical protein FGIG_10969 [Fasciola gigantica]|uniref:Uncharacterized protein n=1 Tax=Fasciola gigantica TaxID=46835 RepID=A0A504Z0C2_FASGI|nr:hypothetical protein FGIG_10969 [Fasciola gigantica]